MLGRIYDNLKSRLDSSIMKTSVPSLGLYAGALLICNSIVEYITIYNRGITERIISNSQDFRLFLIMTMLIGIIYASTWMIRGNKTLDKLATLGAVLHIGIAVMRYDITELISRNYHWYLSISAVYLIISLVRGKKYAN